MAAARLLNPARCRLIPWLLLWFAAAASAQSALPDPMRPALPTPAPPPIAVPSPTASPGPPASAVQPQPLPRLQGMLHSSQGVRVLVDGQLLSPGTPTGPYRVLAVHQGGIELLWQGRVVWLSLYPEADRTPAPRTGAASSKPSLPLAPHRHGDEHRRGKPRP